MSSERGRTSGSDEAAPDDLVCRTQTWVLIHEALDEAEDDLEGLLPMAADQAAALIGGAAPRGLSTLRPDSSTLALVG